VGLEGRNMPKRLLGKILCWLGFHNFLIISESFSFGGGGIETVECQRCGLRKARNASSWVKIPLMSAFLIGPWYQVPIVYGTCCWSHLGVGHASFAGDRWNTASTKKSLKIISDVGRTRRDKELLQHLRRHGSCVVRANTPKRWSTFWSSMLTNCQRSCTSRLPGIVIRRWQTTKRTTKKDVKLCNASRTI